MDLAEWLQAFRELHDRARCGDLSGDDRRTYLAAREELARAFVGLQRLPVSAGLTPRQALRVARALQVDLDTPLEHHRVMTLNICVGGFSALLAKAPRPDDEMKCTVRLPGGEHFETTAKAVGSKPQGGSTNVSFTFGKLADADRERLELFVFDIALEQLATR
jgi:hypothetical protein